MITGPPRESLGLAAVVAVRYRAHCGEIDPSGRSAYVSPILFRSTIRKSTEIEPQKHPKGTEEKSFFD
jgi:hypothetical protein